jgi:hypothetical protein
LICGLQCVPFRTEETSLEDASLVGRYAVLVGLIATKFSGEHSAHISGSGAGGAILKTKEVLCSETSITYEFLQRSIYVDLNPNEHRCENLNSDTLVTAEERLHDFH